MVFLKKASIKNGIIDSVFFIVFTLLVISDYKTLTAQKEHLGAGVLVVHFWNPSSASSLAPPLGFDTTQGSYKKITLTGVQKSDSLKMHEIKESLSVFKEEMDEARGIHIVFGDKTKYGDFIKVLNYCLMESIHLYTPYKNNIWIPASQNLTK